MLNKVIKYTTTACVVSLVALSANAETLMNRAIPSERKVTPIPTKAMQSSHSSNTETKHFMHKRTETPVNKSMPSERKVASTATKSHNEVKSEPAKTTQSSHPSNMETKHSMHKRTETPINRSMRSEKIGAIHTGIITDRLKSEKKEHEKHSKKHEIFDGHNFFIVKGGVATTVHALGDTTSLSTPKATYTVGMVIGREFMDTFALDLEYMHRGESKATAGTTSWKLKSNAVMANFKLDLVKDSTITPYLRAGTGISINQSSSNYTQSTSTDSITYPGKTTSQFAWQAGLGFNFNYNPMLDTELEYMYVDHGKFTTQSSRINTTDIGSTTTSVNAITGKLKDHVITFGVKINF